VPVGQEDTAEEGIVDIAVMVGAEGGVG
jgi:hypothetical protein